MKQLKKYLFYSVPDELGDSFDTYLAFANLQHSIILARFYFWGALIMGLLLDIFLFFIGKISPVQLIILMFLNGTMAVSMPFFELGFRNTLKSYRKGKKRFARRAKTLLAAFVTLNIIVGCQLTIHMEFMPASITFFAMVLLIYSTIIVCGWKRSVLMIGGSLAQLTILLLLFRRTFDDVLIDLYFAFCISVISFYFSRRVYTMRAQAYLQKITIREKNKTLITTYKTKDMVMGAVAHDLRSPIASIHNLAELILLDNKDSETSEYAKLIQEACSRTNHIIMDITMMAELQNESPDIREDVNINYLIRNTAQHLKFRAEEKEQTFEFDLPDAPVFLHVDKLKFERMLENLITNAVKFTPDRGFVKISARVEDDEMKIFIQDTGIGIPEEDIPAMFDPFTRSKRVGTRGERPVGLGMSIVKDIVEKHNGVIDVKSKVNTGTLVSLSFPLRESSTH